MGASGEERNLRALGSYFLVGEGLSLGRRERFLLTSRSRTRPSEHKYKKVFSRVKSEIS